MIIILSKVNLIFRKIKLNSSNFVLFHDNKNKLNSQFARKKVIPGYKIKTKVKTKTGGKKHNTYKKIKYWD